MRKETWKRVLFSGVTASILLLSTIGGVAAVHAVDLNQDSGAGPGNALQQQGTPAGNDSAANGEGIGAAQDGGRGGRGGAMYTETDPNVLSVIENTKDKFVQLSYEDTVNSETLPYSLFVPENLTEGTQYPLIMYIPDASASGKSAKELPV